MPANEVSAAGEAHINAYRDALEKYDYATAIRELVAAIKADARRYAPFPVGKYLPQRILSSDGVGTAFLCRVKENGDAVVVKALNTEAFDRPLDDVFADAQSTRRIYQPALIRVREVGYIDA